MTEDIAVIAEQVRFWAEGQAESRDPGNAKDLNAWCAIASAQLYRELVSNGYSPKLYIAVCDIGAHIFVNVDDHVVDVTATQFPEFRDQPVVIIHEHFVRDHWYYNFDKSFDTVEELIAYQRKHRWPREQIAWSK